MSFVVNDFLTAFPEFSDGDIYPVGTIEYWASIAVLRLNATRWGNLLTHGQYLFVAHNIALAAQATRAASMGGDVARSSGLLASKSVGDVSMGVDTSTTAEQDGGNWNLTRYGRDLLRLVRIVGIGGLQILTEDVETGSVYSVY